MPMLGALLSAQRLEPYFSCTPENLSVGYANFSTTFQKSLAFLFCLKFSKLFSLNYLKVC